MTGERLPDGLDWSPSIPSGAYWRGPSNRWYAITPDGQFVDVTTWQVTEHEDRTITVHPSILVKGRPGAHYEPEQRAHLIETYGHEEIEAWERGRPDWHGWLTRGVWREC